MTRHIVQWLFILVAGLVSFGGKAVGQDFLWLKTAVGGGAEVSRSIAVDSPGSVYIAGGFNSSNVLFGNILLTNANPGLFDVFIARYNTDGGLVWAQRLGGTNYERANSIAVDKQGNCYVTGYFNTTNFLIGTTTLTNFAPNGNSSIFTAKFDPAGNPMWARGPDKGYNSTGTKAAVDLAGNCYVTGSISGTNTFGGSNLISRGYADVLLLKYDTDGKLFWVKQGGGNSNDSGTGVVADPAGNVYLLADIRSTNAIFGTNSFSVNATNVDQDIVVAKYDSSGNVVWARQFGGTGLDSGTGIGLGNNGNIFVTGTFNSTNLVFGSTTLTNDGGIPINGIYLAKLDSSGNPLWAKAAHGDVANVSEEVAVDFAGNSCIAGYFLSSNLVFDAAVITNTETGFNRAADAFAAKFDPVGNLLWVAQPLGTNEQRAFSIAVDATANAYITGWTQGTNVLFGSFATTNAYLDLFVAKIDSDYTFLQISMSNASPVISWPAAHREGFVPEVTIDFQTWSAAGGLITTNDGRKYLTNIVHDIRGFFRLRQAN